MVGTGWTGRRRTNTAPRHNVLVLDKRMPISHVVVGECCAIFGQDEWTTCQRNWLYLESIFSAPDIQRQLPAEAKMFMTVDKSWKEIMRKVYRLPNALRAATQPGNLSSLP